MKFAVPVFPASTPGRQLFAAGCLLLTAAAASGQSVVINKYQNAQSTPGNDNVELLVTGGGVPGSTVDMRRMLLKDYSGSMANDNGGKIRFNDVALFSAVKAGTLIVVTDAAPSPDADASDYVLRLGLRDTTYFTKEAGTFDISATEMIMIKGQDAPADGGTGSLHTLAGGTAGTQFNNETGKKLISTGNSANPAGVMANNSTSSLTDFDGTDATGAVPAASLVFGTPNNAANGTFIQVLKGGPITPNGAGVAGITNTTAGSPFVDKNLFPRNTPGQTVAISLASSLPAGADAITSVKVTVPAAMSAPVEANVAVTGAGAGTPAVAVSGHDVTITGVAITSAAPVVISLSGLTTPDPVTLTNDGRYQFPIQTAGDGGTLTSLSVAPAALVQIPVANLRDVDANGVPLDKDRVVAISAVCTEANFNATGTSAYVQDGDFGINVFVSGTDLALTAGTRYAITGSIIQFNGLTEINPAGAASVIALGPDTAPVPLTISLANLLANPEAFEGRLVKVQSLNYVSGTWMTAADPPLIAGDNATPQNTFEIRIQSGSTAFTPPAWPATITGIFGQYDTSSPYTSGYQLMPRSDADVESQGGGTGYDGWAAAYPGIGGPSDDADSDGSSNLLEYAGGSIPNNGASLPQTAQILNGNTLSVAWAKGGAAAADPKLTWSIESSTTMAADSWTTQDIVNLANGPTNISGDYVIQPGTSKAFLRLKVVRLP